MQLASIDDLRSGYTQWVCRVLGGVRVVFAGRGGSVVSRGSVSEVSVADEEALQFLEKKGFLGDIRSDIDCGG